MRLTPIASAAALGVALVFGCSEDDEGGTLNPTTGSGGSSSSSGGTTSGGTSVGGTVTTGFGGTNAGGEAGAGTGGSGNAPPVDACQGLPVENNSGGEGGEAGAAACLGTGYQADPVEVAMYIMLDQSGSMDNGDPSRWATVTQAVNEFVQDPAVADVGVGIQFFSYDDTNDCDVGQYSTPAVPIGPASDVAGDISDAIDEHYPIGTTPTLPALQGAVDYATAYAADNENTRAVVVFVTDGYPTQCPEGGAPFEQISAVAADALSDGVSVYAVGIDGVYNLDQIAIAGGTGRAFNVENDGATDSFVQALINISREAVKCDYAIPEPPDGMLVDYEEVQVIYTPTGSDTEEVPMVGSLAECAEAEYGGWYYDSPSAPTRIAVCPCTCSRFAAGEVQVRLGCKPQINPG